VDLRKQEFKDMTLSKTLASLKKLRTSAPGFQQTFVSASQFQGGRLTVDQVVFEPAQETMPSS
jgi:hypothetical protein